MNRDADEAKRAPRFFLRVPVAESPEDALDGCDGVAPVLHTRPGGDIVGIVEVRR